MSKAEQQCDYEKLVQRNRGRLAAIARTYAKDETEDLLQEILLQIWRSWQRFEQRANIDTWCYRIALNTAISWSRSDRRRERGIDRTQVDVNSVSGGIDGSDETKLLERFLTTLSVTDRGLVLMYLDDLSGKEMADVTGLSEGAVRVRIHRIKKQLEEWNPRD